jgi:hypothetical protein
MGVVGHGDTKGTLRLNGLNFIRDCHPDIASGAVEELRNQMITDALINRRPPAEDGL